MARPPAPFAFDALAAPLVADLAEISFMALSLITFGLIAFAAGLGLGVVLFG